MKNAPGHGGKTWAVVPRRPTVLDAAAATAYTILSSPLFVAVMTLACLYSLFVPDARLVFIEPRYDKLLLAAAAVVLALFVAEMLMSLLAIRDYLDVRVRRCGCQSIDAASVDVEPKEADALLDSDDVNSATSGARRRGIFCRQCWWLEIGSFTFWLDILSLQALVLDVAMVARDSQPLLVRYGALSELALALTRAGRVSRIGSRVVRAKPLVRKWLADAAAWRLTWKQLHPNASRWAQLFAWCSFFKNCCCSARAAAAVPSSGPISPQPLQLAAAVGGPAFASTAQQPRPSASVVASAAASADVGSGQTRVGAELTALMIKRLITGVLLAAVIVPLLSFDAVDTSKPYETMALRTGAALAAAQQWLLQACALAGGRPVMSVRVPRSFAAVVPETLLSLPLVSGSPNIFCSPPLTTAPTAAPAAASGGGNSSSSNSSSGSSSIGNTSTVAPASPVLSVFGTVAPLMPAQALLEPYSWRYCGNYAFLYGPGGRMGPPSSADSIETAPLAATAGVISAPSSAVLSPARAGSAEACLRLRNEIALPPPNDTRAAVSILDALVAQYSGPGTGFVEVRIDVQSAVLVLYISCARACF